MEIQEIINIEVFRLSGKVEGVGLYCTQPDIDLTKTIPGTPAVLQPCETLTNDTPYTF